MAASGVPINASPSSADVNIIAPQTPARHLRRRSSSRYLDNLAKAALQRVSRNLNTLPALESPAPDELDGFFINDELAAPRPSPELPMLFAREGSIPPPNREETPSPRPPSIGASSPREPADIDSQAEGSEGREAGTAVNAPQRTVQSWERARADYYEDQPDVFDAIHEAIRNMRLREGGSGDDGELDSNAPNDQEDDLDEGHEHNGYMNREYDEAPEDPPTLEELAASIEELSRDFPELLINDEEIRHLDQHHGTYNSRTKEPITIRQLISLALYQIKTRGNIARATHQRYVDIVSCAMPTTKPHDIRTVQALIQRTTGIGHVLYDRCVNNCVCYAKYPTLDTCPNPNCKDPKRYDAQGRPRAQFEYIPIIHQIRLLWADPVMARHPKEWRQKLAHLQAEDSEARPDAGLPNTAELTTIMRDFWDAKLPKELIARGMLTNERDLAFYFSTDGVSLFKHGKNHAVWPLILTCFNLAPDLRFNEDKVLCLGIITGPKKPWDLDSFLVPMVNEFKQLHNGIPGVWDSSTSVSSPGLEIDPNGTGTDGGPTADEFTARAYITVIGGDQPAKDELMGLAGFASRRPCNYCLIRGTWCTKPGHMYVPLVTPEGTEKAKCHRFNPLRLVPRDHDKSFHDAQHVKAYADGATMTRSGIKKRVCFWELQSVIWPHSYTIDNMHLFYLNVAKLMRDHWRGHMFKWEKVPNAFGSAKDAPYKSSGEGYCIPPAVWQQIDADLTASRSLLPCYFGDPLRPVSEFRKAAEWKLWTQTLSPILLRRRLHDEAYQHWMGFVRAVTVATDYSISLGEIGYLRIVLAAWVEDYERIYYRYKHSRLPACRSVIHALLHVANSLQWLGPMWSNGQWTVERMCGLWTPKVKLKFLADRNLSLAILRSIQVNAMASTADIMTLNDLGQPVRLNFGLPRPEDEGILSGTHDLVPESDSDPTELSPLWDVMLAQLRILQLRALGLDSHEDARSTPRIVQVRSRLNPAPYTR